MKAITNFVLFAAFAFVLSGISSCSLSRSLKEGEYLLKQNKVILPKGAKVQDKQQMSEELRQIAVQKPNNKVFGFMPIKLWFFLAASTKKENKFTWWIKNKVGEPPVVFDSLLTAKTDRAMLNYMQNMGYFAAEVKHESTYRKRKATVYYYIEPKDYWKIGRVMYPRPTYTSDSIVWQNHKKSLLVSGARFDVKNLKAERDRIETDLKNSGFFFFNKDYVSFELDTSAADHTVNINVVINQPNETTQHQQFWINNLYTTTDFGTDVDGVVQKRDTLKILEHHFIYKKRTLRPAILIDGTFLSNRSATV